MSEHEAVEPVHVPDAGPLSSHSRDVEPESAYPSLHENGPHELPIAPVHPPRAPLAGAERTAQYPAVASHDPRVPPQLVFARHVYRSPPLSVYPLLHTYTHSPSCAAEQLWIEKLGGGGGDGPQCEVSTEQVGTVPDQVPAVGELAWHVRDVEPAVTMYPLLQVYGLAVEVIFRS